MNSRKAISWIVATVAICIVTTTSANSREDREDPSIEGAIMTQEIIDQIYLSGAKCLARPRFWRTFARC
jgi:hypothetical protein